MFELQTDEGMISHNKELLQGCMVLLSCIQENVKIKNTAINQIKITLDQAYKVCNYTINTCTGAYVYYCNTIYVHVYGHTVIFGYLQLQHVCL